MKNILFIGTYQRKVDSKGRVSIPAEWRRHLNNSELYIFKAEWSNYNVFVDLNNIEQKDLQYVKRYKLDSTGRIVIDMNTGSLLLKGCGDYFIIEFLD